MGLCGGQREERQPQGWRETSEPGKGIGVPDTGEQAADSTFLQEPEEDTGELTACHFNACRGPRSAGRPAHGTGQPGGVKRDGDGGVG